MSHHLWKVFSVLVIAVAIVPFAINRSEPPKLPTGTYWNEGRYGFGELKLYEDGTYTYGGLDSVSVEGAYAIAGDQITFVDFGQPDAPCLHLPGKYKWTYRARVLLLQVIDDQCPTREYEWSFGQWVKRLY